MLCILPRCIRSDSLPREDWYRLMEPDALRSLIYLLQEKLQRLLFRRFRFLSPLFLLPHGSSQRRCLCLIYQRRRSSHILSQRLPSQGRSESAWKSSTFRWLLLHGTRWKIQRNPRLRKGWSLYRHLLWCHQPYQIQYRRRRTSEQPLRRLCRIMYRSLPDQLPWMRSRSQVRSDRWSDRRLLCLCIFQWNLLRRKMRSGWCIPQPRLRSYQDHYR